MTTINNTYKISQYYEDSKNFNILSINDESINLNKNKIYIIDIDSTEIIFYNETEYFNDYPKLIEYKEVFNFEIGYKLYIPSTSEIYKDNHIN